jgi:hypothetical protein
MPSFSFVLKSLFATVAVLIAGVVVSLLCSAVLDHFMQPKDFPHVLRQALTAPPSSPDWPEIQQRLRHAGLITVYAADPLAGLVTGILVGFLQRKRAAIIAAGCMVPNFWLEFSADRARNWAASGNGIAIYLFDHSLPFITAMLGAMLCRRLIRSRRETSPDLVPRLGL